MFRSSRTAIPRTGMARPGLLALLGALLAIATVAGHPQPASAQKGMLTGFLRAVVACGPGGESYGYFLDNGRGQAAPLQVAPELLEARGGIAGLVGQRVRVQGQVRALAGGSSVVQAADLARDPNWVKPSVAPSGQKNYLTVLVLFADDPAHSLTPAQLQPVYGTGFGTMGHYWSTASNGALTFTGDVHPTVLRLSQPKSHYQTSANSFGYNFAQIFYDTAVLLDGPGQNPVSGLRGRDGMNLVFTSALAPSQFLAVGTVGDVSILFNQDSGSYGGTFTWPVTANPPLVPESGYHAGLLYHEMGHNLTWQHSSSTTEGQIYDSPWDLMSNALSNPNGLPGLGRMAQRPSAFQQMEAGWLGAHARTVNPGEVVSELVLGASGDSGTTTWALKLPIAGSTRFYTVEFRQQQGYDVSLPSTCCVIHIVDVTLTDRKAQVVNGTVGDHSAFTAGAQWTTGETFEDAAGGVKVEFLTVGPSSATLKLNGAGSSTVTLADAAATPNPVDSGEPTTLSVTVNNAPAGARVLFFDGETQLGAGDVVNGTASLPATFTNGTASPVARTLRLAAVNSSGVLLAETTLSLTVNPPGASDPPAVASATLTLVKKKLVVAASTTGRVDSVTVVLTGKKKQGRRKLTRTRTFQLTATAAGAWSGSTGSASFRGYKVSGVVTATSNQPPATATASTQTLKVP